MTLWEEEELDVLKMDCKRLRNFIKRLEIISWFRKYEKNKK